MTLGDFSRRLLVYHVMKKNLCIIVYCIIQYYVSHCIDPYLSLMSFIHFIFKVFTFYHQSIDYQVGYLRSCFHFARSVARLATFHDLLNLTPGTIKDCIRVFINLVPVVIYKKDENNTDKWWTSGGKGWMSNEGFVTWL